jgi:hypothetical protein
MPEGICFACSGTGIVRHGLLFKSKTTCSRCKGRGHRWVGDEGDDRVRAVYDLIGKCRLCRSARVEYNTARYGRLAPHLRRRGRLFVPAQPCPEHARMLSRLQDEDLAARASTTKAEREGKVSRAHTRDPA